MNTRPVASQNPPPRYPGRTPAAPAGHDPSPAVAQPPAAGPAGAPRRTTTTLLALAAATAALLAGCGTGETAQANDAPVLEVVTGLYPLAQAAQQIGQNRVKVVDPVPAGTDPRTYTLDPAHAGDVHQAGLVLLDGPVFQPAFERAAVSSHARVLDLQHALGTHDAYFWLDPVAMQKAVAAIATAMEEANPAASSLYRNGEQGFAALVRSTGIDYESTLSACPRTTFVTEDAAFASLAARYGLKDLSLAAATGPSTLATTEQQIRDSGVTTVFTEPFAPATAGRTATSVTSATGTKQRALDTLTGPPAGGWPRQATYINLMESNLGALSKALGCPDSSTGTS